MNTIKRKSEHSLSLACNSDITTPYHYHSGLVTFHDLILVYLVGWFAQGSKTQVACDSIWAGVWLCGAVFHSKLETFPFKVK